MVNNREVPIARPYVSEKAIQAVVDTLRSGWIGQGPKVKQFEQAFRETIGVPYAVAINNCAAGLRLALAISGVGPGDEVITTPLTWQATNHPILEQFARPVFADIQFLTGNIAPDDIEHRVTERTRAILCIHWGGYPADMDEIHAIANKYGLSVIEEAAEALGATYRGRPVGALSRFTSFSFYAVQIVTTVEGGMLTMLNEGDYEAAMRRRWFGIDRVRRKLRVDGYYDYDTWETGYGYPMNDVMAAMGLTHLEELDSLLERRRTIASTYRKALDGVPGVTLFEDRPDRTSGHQLFTIHVERRDDFCRMMRDKGVGVSVMHVRNDQYSVFRGLRDDLPTLDRFSESYINVPLHNQLTNEDVQYVVQCVREGW